MYVGVWTLSKRSFLPRAPRRGSTHAPGSAERIRAASQVDRDPKWLHRSLESRTAHVAVRASSTTAFRRARACPGQLHHRGRHDVHQAWDEHDLLERRRGGPLAQRSPAYLALAAMVSASRRNVDAAPERFSEPHTGKRAGSLFAFALFPAEAEHLPWEQRTQSRSRCPRRRRSARARPIAARRRGPTSRRATSAPGADRRIVHACRSVTVPARSLCADNADTATCRTASARSVSAWSAVASRSQMPRSVVLLRRGLHRAAGVGRATPSPQKNDELSHWIR